MQPGIFITQSEAKKLISQQAEMKAMLLIVMEKLDRLTKKQQKQEYKEAEYWTIDEIAQDIRKSRTTVKNYLQENPQIRRKKEGKKLNLVHRKDFQNAYETPRKAPFIEEVINRSKVA